MTKNNKFIIQGNMWFFYIIGWIFAVFNLLFWIVELIAYLVSEDKHKFIDKTFHKIVYIWGIISFIMIIIMLLLIILGFSIPFLMIFSN